MKKNYFVLLSCLIIAINSVFAQSERILVFLNDGVSIQETMLKSGGKEKKALIKKASLKSSLQAINILEENLVCALPNFNRADTLRVLNDGRIMKQADMSKLYKVQIPTGKTTEEVLTYLNSLPEVLYAEADGLISPAVVRPLAPICNRCVA